MSYPQERLMPGISAKELERRWTAVRAEMKKQGYDFLIMQNNDTIESGFIRWFTDLYPRHGMPMTVIFPAEGEMSTIMCGVDPPAENPPAPWAARGIKNRLGRCFFPTLNYTNDYESELAAPVLMEKTDHPVIGLVGPATISMTFFEGLKKRMGKAIFKDATDLVDPIKSVKSPEEIELIKASAALGDLLVEHLYEVIKPGIRDIDVYAEMKAFLGHHNSERNIIMVGSAPEGLPAAFDMPRYQNRTIQKGDNVSILMEYAGPGGMFTEIFRPIVVGRDPLPIEQERFDAAVEAQEAVASAIKPGASCKELWDIHAKVLQKHGLVVKQRAFSHAQGYGYMERPNLRPDEDWEIKEGLNLAIHPYAEDLIGPSSMCMDNYLVTKDGAVRLHKTPKKIVVIK